MIDRIKYYWNTLRDCYVIQVDYVHAEKPGDIPVTQEKKYIIYNKDESIDYTEDVKQATGFGMILGSLIVKRLRTECKDLPNLQFDLVSQGDAHFIDTIANGSAVAYNSKKEPIDYAAEELFKFLGKNLGVNGVGSRHVIDTEKKSNTAWIDIHVKDQSTKRGLEQQFPNNLYKTFPIKITIVEEPKAQTTK